MIVLLLPLPCVLHVSPRSRPAAAAAAFTQAHNDNIFWNVQQLGARGQLPSRVRRRNDLTNFEFILQTQASKPRAKDRRLLFGCLLACYRRRQCVHSLSPTHTPRTQARARKQGKTEWVVCGSRHNQKKVESRGLQHPHFPSGHPPQYSEGLTGFNFGKRNGNRCFSGSMTVSIPSRIPTVHRLSDDEDEGTARLLLLRACVRACVPRIREPPPRPPAMLTTLTLCVRALR